MKKYFYLNGKILPLDKPAIFANDLGLLRGYGAVDFMKTVNGKPFFLRDHFTRFRRSARLLGLRAPIEESALEKILFNLLEKNRSEDASFRLVLTPGRTPDGMSRLETGNFYILTEDLYKLPDEIYTKGAKLITAEHERLLPLSKNINYLEAMRLQPVKIKRSALEILYKKDGRVTECSTSNFFIVKKGAEVTAKDAVLSGITRRIVINLAKKAKVPVVERNVLEKEIYGADEAFITATNKKIAPIIAIDGQKIGNGRPGPVTLQLLKAYDKLLANY